MEEQSSVHALEVVLKSILNIPSMFRESVLRKHRYSNVNVCSNHLPCYKLATIYELLQMQPWVSANIVMYPETGIDVLPLVVSIAMWSIHVVWDHLLSQPPKFKLHNQMISMEWRGASTSSCSNNKGTTLWLKLSIGMADDKWFLRLNIYTQTCLSSARDW